MLRKLVSTWFLFCWFPRLEAFHRESRLKLVIDHDGGADDAMAITMCLRYDSPRVIGLTTTNGNVNLSQAIVNSGRILSLANRHDVRLYAGSEHPLINGVEPDNFFGSDGLGDTDYHPRMLLRVRKEPAAVALVQLSKMYREKLIVIAIGPLTNIALAVKLDPNFISRLKHLYVGGGNIYDEENPTEPEFNANMDAEAYYIVSKAATPDKVTFVPFSQIQSSLNITKEWRENVLGAIQTPMMKVLNTFERISLAKSTNWSLLDPAVAAIALKDTMVKEIKNSNNTIILSGDKRGITTNDFSSTKPNVKIVFEADVEAYKQLLLDIYNAELVSYPKWH